MFKFVVTKNLTELFHRAVLQNDLVRVKLLLEQATDESKFNVDEINEDGLTALQFSCFASNLELVRLLVQHGANVKVQDRDGWTVAHAAALGGNVDVVRYLAKLGVHVCHRNDKGQLPIDLATDIPTVIILLKYMLENSHHDEVQAYLRRHPDLKYEISREINLAIKSEQDERVEMASLPYTSHGRNQRRNSNQDALNNNTYRPKRKVKGSFSMLPSPVQLSMTTTETGIQADSEDDVAEIEELNPKTVTNNKDRKKVSRSAIHRNSGSSLAESDSSSVASDRSHQKNIIEPARGIHRTVSARSDEYYNYHFNHNRTRLRDEEVRRSICLGNMGKDRLPYNTANCFYSDDERRRVGGGGGRSVERSIEPLRRTASVQYPEVYI